ncbi:lipid II flippase family protein [Pelagerythrobacter aerophilus]
MYSSSESLANVARHAGAKTERYSLGLMLANQVYSLNRLNGFLIAPLLGFYVDSGGSEGDLKIAALFGCVASAILLIGLIRVWPFFLRICTNVLIHIERDGFKLSVVYNIFLRRSGVGYSFTSRRKDILIVMMQGVTTSLATPTAFILNILAIRYPEYQTTLVQSATVISGVGNLLLNFYIFPKLALAETRGQPDHIYHSIMLGKILGIGVISTCIIAII